VSFADVAAGRQDVLMGLRGARGTAAGWGAAWAALFLFVVIGPYRRGDVATWWGILASTLVLTAVVAARALLVPGLQAGISTPLIILAIVVVGLLLDVRRLRRP
jgi:hypothetical protein